MRRKRAGQWPGQLLYQSSFRSQSAVPGNVLGTAVCSTWEGTFFFLIKEAFNFFGIGVRQIHIYLDQKYQLE